MKLPSPFHRLAVSRSLCLAAAIFSALPLLADAGAVAIATAPLATSTTSTVKPNVMFILDDSGSMDRDYLPDWVADNDPVTGKAYTTVPLLHRNSFFNGNAYNPAVTYLPPVLFDASGNLNTTTYPNRGSPWTSVKNDGYNIQSTGSTNLVTSFQDVEWCTDTTYTDCLRNDNYVLPGMIGGRSYNVSRAVNSTGMGKVASGPPDAPTVSSRTFGPFYYVTNPGEFCKAVDLKECQLIQTATFSKPSYLRWCNSSTAATSASPAIGACQALNSSTFRFPRFPTRFFTAGSPGSAAVPAVPPSPAIPPTNGTIRMTAVARNRTISFRCGGVFFGKTGTFTSSNSGTASTRLDELFTSVNGSNVNGYTMTCAKSGSPTNRIDCSVGAPAAPSACPGGFTIDSDITVTINTGPMGGADAFPGSPFIPAVPPVPAGYYGSFTRVEILPGNTYPKASTRTDCAGAACTYDEEMTNFANWWSYYRTRMQSMKTSVGRAFKSIDNRFRVGYSTILETSVTDGDRFLGNKTFELAHKNKWFTTLYKGDPTGFTPLRGAISKAGQYYARKAPGQTAAQDPVQYSCQQNFTILSTDGYWNTNAESASYGPFGLAGASVGNLDGGSTPRPFFEGTTAVSNTLADVSKYYFDTDLRNPGLGNCAGGTSTDFPMGNPNVCPDNVFISATDKNTKQHMTTFTMGLGIDGTLNFTTDYATATSGDFYNLKNGLGSPTVNWPNPISNTEGERIDDLWHAAVNGGGLYFSAKDPDSIVTGFQTALSSITAKLGAAAAAATSTLNPVAGNNFAYVASYTTNVWKGNLEARTINVSTGVVSETATWCVESLPAQTCQAPGTIVADTSGSSTIYNCSISVASAAECASPGVFDSGTSTCRTEIQNSCSGTMPSKVSATSDTRTIFTANATRTALIPFDAAFATSNPSHFDAAKLAGLSQWGLLTAGQRATAVGANLVNYLRGQTGYEDRASNPALNRLYRAREATLGDALESQPAFISKPVFSYPYPGYDIYKANQASRAGTVYMGTNDGMMHAFDAANGVERWAYIPSVVVSNLWRLADVNYAHANFANGSPVTTDICTADCTSAGAAAWKTVLIAGLNGGGRGYFALDITNPTSPSLLWEFTPANDADLGYSFGVPIVTRKNDGTWVVLVTSGYNNGTASANPMVSNSPAGNGGGYLYVLNAGTGAIISKISTGAGSASNPSGLGKIAAFLEETDGNLAGFVYGGDLEGNLWRFDINSTTTATIGTGSAFKFATLLDPSGAAQPITTTPVLGRVAGKRVIFVGTGKYLETSDLLSTQVQTQYAIKDDDATTTLVNARLSLVQQTLSNIVGTGQRTVTDNVVDFSTGRGWYFNFPDSKERVNIDSRLVQGTLLIPSIVPENSICSPGGFGYLNFVNYEDGGRIDSASSLAGVKYDSTLVGVNVIYIAGKPVVEVVTSTNPTPEKDPNVLFGASTAGFVGKRVLWRELTQ
jgi:type IV pilus assembly protein PilY1